MKLVNQICYKYTWTDDIYESNKENPPYSSTNLRAFSKKHGAPSTSSKASKIGTPIIVDFAGGFSFAVKEIQKTPIFQRGGNHTK